MTTNKANTSKEVQAAAAMAITFDVSTAHQLLISMASSDSDMRSGKTERDNASLEFCQFAADVVVSNDGIERSTITDGFCKHLDSLRPMLAAEGSPFVETKTTDEATRYVWKGHGNNVKSIAKGVTEFVNVIHVDENGDEYAALIDLAEAESFTDVKKSVEQARRYGEDTELVALREAKDVLREAIKELQSFVLGTNDIELIDQGTADVNELRAHYEACSEAQEALDAEVQADGEDAVRALVIDGAELNVTDENMEATS